ncbi:MAG: PD40 domain-containing protein [Chitinophagales bacterium]|nr:PD40 domain-containing protein [Chitinophagales bacterium]
MFSPNGKKLVWSSNRNNNGGHDTNILSLTRNNKSTKNEKNNLASTCHTGPRAVGAKNQ